MSKPPTNYKKLGKRAAYVLCSLLVVTGSIVAIRHYQLNNVALSQMAVTGDSSLVSSEQVQMVLRPYVNKELVELDIEQIKMRLLAVPRVKNVALRRQWPSTLEIRLYQHQVVAHWQALNGQRYGLSNDGALVAMTEHEMIFNSTQSMNATSHAQSLKQVLLSGPDNEQKKVLNQYAQFIQAMASVLPAGAVSKMHLDARGTWTVHLNNTLKVMFLDESKASAMVRLRIALLAFTPEQLQQAEYIDLRYNNGFATQWRTQDV